MPIYEFACPRCRKIFSFLSKKLQPEKSPACPQCGSVNLAKQLSSFALPKAGIAPEAGPGAEPDMNDPRVLRAMGEVEKDLEHLDENNPMHLAHMMKKMKDILPPESMPKEFDIAIKRLEAGEDPEKIEADLGDLFGAEEGEGESGTGGAGGFTRDSGLYDY
jgi:putative FmdB family regulatory protein